MPIGGPNSGRRSADGSGGNGFVLTAAGQDEPFIALLCDFSATLAVWSDTAGIGQEDARLAGDVGTHVPGICLREQSLVGEFVDMGDPGFLRFLGRLDRVE